MKAFRFTLQAVRTLRQRQEQLAMEDYAAALRSQQQAEARLAETQQELASGQHQSRNLLADGAAAAQIVQLQVYCRFLEVRGRDREEALNQARTATRQVWQRLLEARRRREVVDKFYDRQREQYARAGQREEQKNLDDLSGRRPRTITASPVGPDHSWN
jgi:flagellar export protein FliJ